MVTAQVLSQRTTLDDNMIDAAYQQFLAEKGLIDDAAASVPAIEITGAPPDDAPSLRLLRIGDTSRVNRLIDGQEIGFNDRMTVVYGENASGKTGYARVLKRVAGARSAGRVLPDVYTSSPGTPTATIEYSLGSDTETVAWHEESPPVPVLGRVCVFDTPAAPLHVDDDLSYLYTPTDIALFEYVHAALSKIRDLLSAERARRAPKGNPFLSRFRRGTTQFSIVESLRASTDLAEMRRQAEVVEDGDTRIADLGDRIRNLESSGQQTQLAGARATQTVCGSAVAVADRLLAFSPQAYASALEDVAACRKRVQDVSEALFSGDHLPGVFTAEWTAFIAAAHQYGVTHMHTAFPDDTTDCPYCRQTLGDDARGLLRRYKSYMVDDSQAALRTAAQALDALIGPVADMAIPDESGANGNGADGDGGLTAAIGRIRALGLRQQTRLSERLPWDADAELDWLREDRRMLDEQRAAAARAVRDLSTEASERERHLSEAWTDLLELEDRRSLRSLLDDIVAHVEAVKWVDLADTVLRTFQGLLRSLTDAMKDATRGILNTTFESAFQRECQLLNCPPPSGRA